MFESKAQSIGICTQTTAGTYALYRSFGCNATDEPLPPMRRYVVEQLASFYPDVKLNQVQITLNNDGRYTVNLSASEGV